MKDYVDSVEPPEVALGLGRIIALHCRSSTVYRIHKYNRYLFFLKRQCDRTLGHPGCAPEAGQPLQGAPPRAARLGRGGDRRSAVKVRFIPISLFYNVIDVVAVVCFVFFLPLLFFLLRPVLLPTFKLLLP